MKKLDQKIAVVTGASRGIGQGIALSLAKEGANLALADISLETLEETKKLIKAEGVKVSTYEIDVNDENKISTTFKKIVSDFGTIDIAVNNAGVIGIHKTVEMTAADWDKIQSVNARGVFLCAKAELEVMLPQNRVQLSMWHQ